LSALVSYVEKYGDDNLVLVFLGDHQPSPLVTGAGAGRDVPITIVARDRAVLDRVSGWGWQDGLRPGPGAPVWRMDTFPAPVPARLWPVGRGRRSVPRPRPGRLTVPAVSPSRPSSCARVRLAPARDRRTCGAGRCLPQGSAGIPVAQLGQDGLPGSSAACGLAVVRPLSCTYTAVQLLVVLASTSRWVGSTVVASR